MKNLKWMTVSIMLVVSAQVWADATPVPITPVSTVTERALVPPSAITAAPPTTRYSLPPQSTPSPTPVSEIQLGGRLGIGTGYLPFGAGSLRSESVRLWLSQDFCLDAEGYYTGTTNNDTDFNGNPVQYPNYTYDFGLGFKYNLKEPAKNLFVQLIFQASYASEYFENNDGFVDNTAHYQYGGLFVGVGFEYFVPFFDSISLESSVGYSQTVEFYYVNQIQNPNYYTPPYNTTSNLTNYASSITVNGMTLSSLIIHFYF